MIFLNLSGISLEREWVVVVVLVRVISTDQNLDSVASEKGQMSGFLHK